MKISSIVKVKISCSLNGDIGPPQIMLTIKPRMLNIFLARSPIP